MTNFGYYICKNLIKPLFSGFSFILFTYKLPKLFKPYKKQTVFLDVEKEIEKTSTYNVKASREN